jgi:hypothetical protein
MRMPRKKREKSDTRAAAGISPSHRAAAVALERLESQ